MTNDHHTDVGRGMLEERIHSSTIIITDMYIHTILYVYIIYIYIIYIYMYIYIMYNNIYIYNVYNICILKHIQES